RDDHAHVNIRRARQARLDARRAPVDRGISVPPVSDTRSAAGHSGGPFRAGRQGAGATQWPERVMKTIQAREQQRHLFTGRWRSVPIATPKEHELQIQLVTMLKWCLRPDVILRHYPAGELRDKRTGAKLRAMGLLAGSADLEFFWKRYWEDLDGSR